MPRSKKQPPTNVSAPTFNPFGRRKLQYIDGEIFSITLRPTDPSTSSLFDSRLKLNSKSSLQDSLSNAIENLQKIKINKLSDPIGLSTFAAEPIKKGERFPFSGIFKETETDEDRLIDQCYLVDCTKYDADRDLEKDVIAYVDCSQSGNETRFLPHLPTNDSLDDYIFHPDSQKIATANSMLEVQWFCENPKDKKENRVVFFYPYLIATEDIDAGSIVGIDYGNIYWELLNHGKGAESAFLNPQGDLVATSNWDLKEHLIQGVPTSEELDPFMLHVEMNQDLLLVGKSTGEILEIIDVIFSLKERPAESNAFSSKNQISISQEDIFCPEYLESLKLSFLQFVGGLQCAPRLPNKPLAIDAFKAMRIQKDFGLKNYLNAKAVLENLPSQSPSTLSKAQIKKLRNTLSQINKAISAFPLLPQYYFLQSEILGKLEKKEDAKRSIKKAELLDKLMKTSITCGAETKLNPIKSESLNASLKKMETKKTHEAKELSNKTRKRLKGDCPPAQEPTSPITYLDDSDRESDNENESNLNKNKGKNEFKIQARETRKCGKASPVLNSSAKQNQFFKSKTPTTLGTDFYEEHGFDGIEEINLRTFRENVPQNGQ